MKIEEIKTLFENGNDVTRSKPLRISSGDSYYINNNKITYKQVRVLEETYNTKETYVSVLTNIIKFVSKK